MSDRCFPHGARACRRCDWLDAIKAERAAHATTKAGLQEAEAEAWDEGYASGLGDCGKDRARETCAANPYRPEEGNDRG